MAQMEQNVEIEPKKMFVGALSWDTTKESMQNYFSAFGEVTNCVVMSQTDPSGNITGKPRGFGFVTFEDDASVDKVLAMSKHTLDGKTIDPKRAKVKGPGPQMRYKVFIGGLSFHTEEPTINEAFVNAGFPPLDGDRSVEIKRLPNENRSRGFGFVELRTEEDLKTACDKKYIEIDGKTVEIKKAETKVIADNKKYLSGNHMSGMMNPALYTSVPYGFGSTVAANVSNTQYNTSNASYAQYAAAAAQQYSNSSYPGYEQHGNNPQVFQNYSSGYPGRGYNSQQQHISANYPQGQPSNYSQSRGNFPSTGTDSYPSGGSGYSYDHNYSYGNDQTGSTSSGYSRMSGSSGSTPGQTRGGSSGYSSYNNH